MTRSESPNDVMSRLRRDTSAVHAEVEALACFARLFAPDYRLVEYHLLLRRLYGFFVTVEPIVFAARDEPGGEGEASPAWSRRLHADLIALGDSEAALAAAERCAEPPDLPTPAHRAGALYVIEGSALGSRIIHRQLHERFGAAVAPALNYYGTQAGAAGARWQRFRSAMAREFGDAAHYPAVLSGAHALFGGLARWLR